MPLDPAASAALTTVTVRSDGTEVPGTFALLSVEMAQVCGSIPYAHLIYQDGDPAAQTFATAADALFAPGAALEIDLGYDRTETTVFRGVLTRLRVEAPQHGSSRLHLEVKHPAVRMHHARVSRTWTDVTDADAIADLAAAHGIAFDGTSRGVRPQLVQHQASDWDFAALRSERIGQLLLGTTGGLTMFAPDLAAEPVADLAYGRTLFSLDIEMNAEAQAAEIAVGAWSAADAAIETAGAGAADFPGPGSPDGASLSEAAGIRPKPRHPGARDQAELDDWAKAEMLRRRLSAITGSLQIQGTAEIAAGAMIRLAGLGPRFDGAAFVSGLRHMLVRGDWRTFLQVGLDPAFHDARHALDAPGAAGLVPSIRGLQIGIVDAVHGDPAGEGRVAVRLATETETSQRIWARPLSIGGGADRGVVLLPDVGSECLLGFLDGDPRDPVLLGGLHSSAAASPLPGQDGNDLKGLVSRAGSRIVFDDAGPALVLETTSGHRVALSDADGLVRIEDATGNSVTLSSQGIALDSPADITLTAKGSVKIDGLKIAAAAQTSAELKGGASATLQSSGQTVVRGATVDIN
jgi:Rhs element Vgr protein